MPSLVRKSVILAALALPAAILFCLAPTASARIVREDVTADFDGTAHEVVYKVSFSSDGLTFGSHMGYDTVTLEGAGYLKRAGEPRLPSRTLYMAIPAGMRVLHVREGAVNMEQIAGTYNIVPAQPPRIIGYDPDTRGWVGPDPEVYSGDVYPATRVSFLRQADLAGQNLVAIQICPLQYSPLTGEVYLATEIEVVLVGEPGYRCGDYLATRASRRSRAMYERMLRSMVVNPGDIAMAEAFTGPLLGGVGPGQYDYVIITRDVYVGDFQSLAEWRTKQGWRVNVVTTDWIYTSGGYTGTDLEKMRAFIVDAHNNWGATHFVLGSDVANIPYHVRSITVPGWQTDDIANDTYYADFDDDWVLEVTVARLSVRNAAQVATMLSKIITYEKNPPLTDYARTAFFIGMDITVCGDMDGENFKENYIRAMHLPGTWTLDTEYDSEPGTHKADIVAYLNAGYHLVNHHDHCNTDCIGAGWTCHSDLFNNADMDALTNGDRLSIFFAVGCYPAHMPTTRCIAEASLRNAGGAGIAFMGNTCIGWGGDAADPDLYSVRQDRYFYRNLFDLGIYNLGENFTRLKNDEFDPVDPYNLHKYAFTQLHLHGDPGLTIWTDDPRTMTVDHITTVPVGEPVAFGVEVSDGGAPVDGATVCLYKAGEIHEVEETTGGEAEFNFTAASAGTLYVTVCNHNYLPYEGMVDVDGSASAEDIDEALPAHLTVISVTPNPFRAGTEIAYAVPGPVPASTVTVDIFNCLGRRVRALEAGEQPAGIHRLAWNGRDQDGNPVASGIYYCRILWRDECETRSMVLLR